MTSGRASCQNCQKSATLCGECLSLCWQGAKFTYPVTASILNNMGKLVLERQGILDGTAAKDDGSVDSDGEMVRVQSSSRFVERITRRL